MTTMNDRPNTWNRHLRRIRERFPDLSIQSVTLNQDGQYNDVLIINEALVFRFARYPAAAERLEREIDILKLLERYVTLPIPRPLFYDLEHDQQRMAFMGYPIIPGRPLWRHVFRQINIPEVLDNLAMQIATFLRELHSVPLDVVRRLRLPLEDEAEAYAAMFTRVREDLFQYMRPEAQEGVTHHFEGFLQNPGVSAFRPALRHGDFGTSNLLWDPAMERLTGVVDFGDAGLGDAAVDFAGILASFGHDFYTRCSDYYPEMRAAVSRARFYAGTFALQEALHGLDTSDADAFGNGIAPYR
ncbi:MAG: aminoglycoside phosphotransferase family protein [Anaerolineales bacterium]|nr:aminoglycoside phosphotransferase family protein [Anaerolineales bacterium]